MNNKALGEQIRKLRMSKKYTLAVMAERIGVTTSAIAAYENGSRNPSHEVLVKIARIFNVTVDNLLNPSDRDLLDVSGLTVEQRDNIEKLVLMYKKINTLIVEIFEVKQDDTIMLNYLENSLDEFKSQVINKKHNFISDALIKEDKRKMIEQAKFGSESGEDKTKDLEDRIKALEEMIKNNQK